MRTTIHRREGEPLYQVDYYLLLTGSLERVVMQEMEGEKAVMEFYKLLEPHWVAACGECVGKEEIAVQLEEMFSGLPEEEEEKERKERSASSG